MILPTNPFDKTNHFGMSITSTFLRGLAVNKQGQMTQVEVPLSRPLNEQDRDLTSLISDALNRLLKAGSFGSDYASVTLPEKLAFSREHVIHHVEKGEIAEAIGWQIEEIFPFKASEIYWDFKILSYAKEDYRVLVTAIQKPLLDQIKEAFEAVKIHAISFEPSAAALAKLVPLEGKTPLLIAEIETTGTTATLVVDGVSVMTATTIINSNTPPQMAWQELINSLINLMDRLKRMDANSVAPKIVLTGEKATTEMASLMANYFKLKAAVLEIKGVTPAFHLAYVAAVSAVQPPSSEDTINLLPTELQEYYQKQVRLDAAKATMKMTLIMVILGLVFQLIAWGVMAVGSAGLRAKINREQSDPLPKGPEGINLALVQKQSQRLILLFNKKVTPESSLDLIIRQLPQGITLSGINFEAAKQEYSLSGIARSRTDVLALKEAIDQTESFTKVVLPLNALENAADYHFLIVFKVKNK